MGGRHRQVRFVRNARVAGGEALGGLLLRRPAHSGYDPGALADCVITTLKALSGAGQAKSIAPDPILTSRAAAQFERYWRLERCAFWKRTPIPAASS
jgi:hypothetical protein